MSATAKGVGKGSGGSDRAYFRAIEELFVRLRGSPLLLSPEDWRIASAWRREGIPFDLVRSTLETLFARRHERGAGGRIQSLKYCAPAVESAWRERRELSAPAAEAAVEPFDAADRLTRLAARLPPRLSAFAPRLIGLSGSPESVEAALGALDRELLAEARAGLDAADRRALERAVERRLARVAARLPAEELAANRERLTRDELRERLGLPLLSLYSPDARP